MFESEDGGRQALLAGGGLRNRFKWVQADKRFSPAAVPDQFALAFRPLAGEARLRGRLAGYSAVFASLDGSPRRRAMHELGAASMYRRVRWWR